MHFCLDLRQSKPKYFTCQCKIYVVDIYFEHAKLLFFESLFYQLQCRFSKDRSYFSFSFLNPYFTVQMTRNGKQMEMNKNSSHHPRKRFYRARAHSNPLSDSHFPIPISPSEVDYSHHYPYFYPDGWNSNVNSNDGTASKIQFADIGCGFGGLLVSLSQLFPDTLMIGMELRDKVRIK